MKFFVLSNKYTTNRNLPIMPIYEFICKKCGKDFEELVFGDCQPACPNCGSGQTSRLMSCCSAHTSGSSGDNYMSSNTGSGGGCSGCSGGNCASCGH